MNEKDKNVSKVSGGKGNTYVTCDSCGKEVPFKKSYSSSTGILCESCFHNGTRK